jgi:hypothetical protein
MKDEGWKRDVHTVHSPSRPLRPSRPFHFFIVSGVMVSESAARTIIDFRGPEKELSIRNRPHRKKIQTSSRSGRDIHTTVGKLFNGFHIFKKGNLRYRCLVDKNDEHKYTYKKFKIL